MESRPAPPHFSGTKTPRRPGPAIFSAQWWGTSWLSSYFWDSGAISRSAKSRTILRVISWVSEGAKSTVRRRTAGGLKVQPRSETSDPGDTEAGRQPEAFIPPSRIRHAMPGLEIVTLETPEAEEFWRAFLAGRTDVPTRDVKIHLDRYLALSPEEQGSYFAFKENGTIVGTVRLAGNAIGGFSLLPDARAWTRDAILLAPTPLIAGGAGRVVASLEDSYLAGLQTLGCEE